MLHTVLPTIADFRHRSPVALDVAMQRSDGIP